MREFEQTHPTSPYTLACRETEFPQKTDFVVIRHPGRHLVTDQAMHSFAKELSGMNFALLIISPDLVDDDVEHRFYPTDSFRQIGQHLTTFYHEDLPQVKKFLHERYKKIADRLPYDTHPSTTFRGGDFLYEDTHKTFVYARNHAFSEVDSTSHGRWLAGRNQEAEMFLDKLKSWGITKIIPIDVGKTHLPGMHDLDFGADLDFLLSIYTGKDDKLHAIAAESLAIKLPGGLFPNIHIIPDSEASKGGCNLADIGGGRVLVLPDPRATPTTAKIIEDFPPLAKVVFAPFNVSGGGGPRCSMSSIPLKPSH